MITEFGKTLRKIRIDHNEILRDMAQHLEVSSSFLSSVEVGKKNVPDGWVDKITEVYNLNAKEHDMLQRQAKDAVKSVKINLCGSGNPQRNAALVFARDFSKISDETAEKIINLMTKK